MIRFDNHRCVDKCRSNDSNSPTPPVAGPLDAAAAAVAAVAAVVDVVVVAMSTPARCLAINTMASLRFAPTLGSKMAYTFSLRYVGVREAFNSTEGV